MALITTPIQETAFSVREFMEGYEKPEPVVQQEEEPSMLGSIVSAFNPFDDEGKQSVTQFTQDPQVIKDGNLYLNALTNDASLLQKVLMPSDVGFESNALKRLRTQKHGFSGDDIVSQIRKEAFTFGGAGVAASFLKDQPVEVQEAHARLKKRFEDDTSLQGIMENLNAIFENGANIVSSPEGLASILASFWTAPARAAAANPALQNAIAKKTLQLIGANSTKANVTKIGVAGMGWGGTGDFLDQNINMANGMQEAFDKERWSTATVLSGILPSALVLGGSQIGKAFGKNKFFQSDVDKKRISDSVNESNIRDKINQEEWASSLEDFDTAMFDYASNVKNHVDAVEKLKIETERGQTPFLNEYYVLADAKAQRNRRLYYRGKVPPPDEPIYADRISKYDRDQTIKNSKRLQKELKEEELYGGRVPDAVVAQIADDFNLQKNDIVDFMYDYEASRDFPTWETISDLAYTELDDNPFIPRSWNDQYPEIYKERTFHDTYVKSLRNYAAFREQKKLDKEASRKALSDPKVKKLKEKIKMSQSDLGRVVEAPKEEIESTESRLYNMLIEEAEEENAIFLNNNPDFIAKLNKKPQFKENKVTNLVDSVTEAIVKAANDERYVPYPEEITSQASKMAKEIGGGIHTTEKIADDIVQYIGGNTGPNDFKATTLKKAQMIHGKVAFGRATKVLTKLKVPTALNLAKRIRHDSLKTYTNDEFAVDYDYNETFMNFAGPMLNTLRLNFEELRKISHGKLKDVVNFQTIRALRNKPADEPAINRAVGNIKRDVLEKGARFAKELGVNIEVDPEYFTRMWSRKAIAKDFYGSSWDWITPDSWKAENAGKGRMRFAELLEEDGEAANREEAIRIIEGMLNKNNDIFSESREVSSFFTKRKFEKITDDNKYEQFLNNDYEELLNSYVLNLSNSLAKRHIFGVDNVQQFKEKWLKPIEAEVNAKANREGAFTNVDARHIIDLYNSVTGEGVTDFETPIFRVARDALVAFTRTALLPVAVLTNLSEAALIYRRVGLQDTKSAFSKAIADASEMTTYNLAKVLRKQGYTEPEIKSELTELYLFLDNSLVNTIDRLGDSALSTRFFKGGERWFYKLTLMDWWTKLMQLTAYHAGKDLIHKNLLEIKKHGSLPESARIGRLRGELDALNININEGLAYLQRSGDQVDINDPFYIKVKRGSSRFVRNVVLDTSARSAIKPAWQSNPKVAMFGELLGYPAAFNNVEFKNIVRDTKDMHGVMRTLGWLTMASSIGALGYWIRNPERAEEMSPLQLQLEGLTRSGGTSMPGDILERQIDYYNNAKNYNLTTAGLQLAGPVGSMASDILKDKGTAQIIGSRVPFSGAITTFGGPNAKYKYDQFLKGLDKESTSRKPFEKGGIVEDVPRVPKEPDERIDKMTGLPYDEQAGEAFEDVEDRERYMFGGVVGRNLSREIAKATSRKGVTIPQNKIDAAANTINEAFTENDVDIPSSLEDPLFEEFIIRRSRALIDEKNDMTVDELREQMPEFFDENNKLIMGDEFSRARGYAEDQISNFNRANEIEEVELGEDLSDVTEFLRYELSRLGAIDNPDMKWTMGISSIDRFKNYMVQDGMANLERYYPSKFYEEKNNIETNLKTRLNNFVDSLDEDDLNVVKRLSNHLPFNTKRPDILSNPIDERDLNLEALLQETVETEPQYRATASGYDTDYDVAAVMPREIGLHVGTKGQAGVMAIRGFKDDNFDNEASSYFRKKIEDEIKEEVKSNKKVEPVQMTKGYIFTKNPLVIEMDAGDWSAANILADNPTLNAFRKAIKTQNKSLDPQEVDNGFRKLISDARIYNNNKLDLEDDVELAEKGMDLVLKAVNRLRLADLNIKFRQYLKSLGFDSIKYLNKLDTPAKDKNKYSYILFEPNQFKSTYASEFDIEDPRQNIRTGGLLKTLKRKNQHEI